MEVISYVKGLCEKMEHLIIWHIAVWQREGRAIYPRDIQALTQLSRTTIYRRLRDLRNRGIVLRRIGGAVELNRDSEFFRDCWRAMRLDWEASPF
jgi:DNA-binding HxlR family transcriptional regulator